MIASDANKHVYIESEKLIVIEYTGKNIDILIQYDTIHDVFGNSKCLFR